MEPENTKKPTVAPMFPTSFFETDGEHPRNDANNTPTNDNLTTLYLALKEEYHPSEQTVEDTTRFAELAGALEREEKDNKTAMTAAAPQTPSSTLPPVVDVAEEIAKGKLEAIRDEIEATDFMTLLGSYGCIEITKRNGENTFIGKYANYIHSLILKTDGNYVIAHDKVKHLARQAISPNRNFFFVTYLTRSNEAQSLYFNILNDQIKPKPSSALRC